MVDVEGFLTLHMSIRRHHALEPQCHPLLFLPQLQLQHRHLLCSCADSLNLYVLSSAQGWCGSLAQSDRGRAVRIITAVRRMAIPVTAILQQTDAPLGEGMGWR